MAQNAVLNLVYMKSATDEEELSGCVVPWVRFLGPMMEALWQSSVEGIVVTDSGGTIRAANPAFTRIMQRPEAEFVGAPFWTLWGAEYESRRMMRAYAQRFSSENIRQNWRHRLIRPNRSTLDLEVSGSSFVVETGERFLLTIVRDCTYQVTYERALRRSEANLSRMFQEAVQPMFQTSADGILISANRAMLSLLGYRSLDELQQVDIANDIYVEPEARARLTNTLLTSGYVRGAELQVRRHDGRILTVVEHSRAVRNARGQVIAYEGILEDITERKALEAKLKENVESLRSSEAALRDLNAQKDKLFSILSHDLRSPITGILGLAEVLREDYDSMTRDQRVEYIQYVHEAAQRQLDLVNHLLDWSRLESGRGTIDRHPIDLSEIAMSCVDMQRGTARRRGITLSAELPAEVHVLGNTQLLTQVFNNLIANALKFTQEGGSITVALSGASPDSWSVAVRDTGIGIPTQDLSKLFRVGERFTTKGIRGEPGTGLGLPIVAEIIEKHDGAIRVESTPGTGTTFYITLPRYDRDERAKVVVVDDEPGNRRLYSHHIHRVRPDVEILEARDGAEAMQLARQPGVMMVISDIDMPHMDGYDLLRSLKESEDTVAIPVVIISGVASFEEADRLGMAGASAVFRKPVRKHQVEDLLEKYLTPAQDRERTDQSG